MQIPDWKLAGPGLPLHFSHANGYPPQAYKSFLTELSRNFHVQAMEARPLWPSSDPDKLESWDLLADDLIGYLEGQVHKVWIGVGHSVGGVTSLMAALKRPDLFRALVIIEPPLFPPWASLAWRLATRLGVSGRLHPLAEGARRRRRVYDSREEMYASYRGKTVFQKISDEDLRAYVEAASIIGDDRKYYLRFSPEWEYKIYIRSLLADFQTFQNLKNLEPPTLFIRAEHSNAFFTQSARLVKKILGPGAVQTTPGATHLLPLENPLETADLVAKFIQSESDLGRGNKKMGKA